MQNKFYEPLQQSIIEGNVPKMVLLIFTISLNMGASDIHIEPREFSVLIRFRVDGTLQEIIEYPASIHSSVMSRMKILANLKIDEQRKPQDGRIQVTTQDRKKLELRVSTVPTLHGEKVCMRLQDKNQTIPEMDKLGIRWKNLDAMMHTIKNPNGVTLVTGPTGSGKTTTLYSALNLLNTPEVNIMTIEDPVEYEMEGLSQSQVYTEIGYDFASGLRTALRQDPDIIMVGEIRDQETIEIAIKAALTGHMVISTIHTNSAAATITRILDMGVKPYKITSALRTIEAQRLMRKLCPHCKKSYTPNDQIKKDMFETLKHVRFKEIDFDMDLIKNPKLWHAPGCAKCENKGTKGRMGVYEVMEMTRGIEELILGGSMEVEIEEYAIEHQGMMTLAQDGYLKALMGEVSLEEVVKLVG